MRPDSICDDGVADAVVIEANLFSFLDFVSHVSVEDA